MITVCPELVREWNYERNKILPEDYKLTFPPTAAILIETAAD